MDKDSDEEKLNLTSLLSGCRAVHVIIICNIFRIDNISLGCRLSTNVISDG